MKPLLLIILLTATLTSAAQNTPNRVPIVRDMTIRAEAVFSEKSMPEDVVWYRSIYREMNLTQEENTPLYYPTEPIGERMNLFTTLFRLFIENKIEAYEYMDGREIFTPRFQITPREILDNYSIIYEEVVNRKTKDTLFIVDDSDIPSSMVKSFYIKEDWYFDQRNSTYRCKINAICPRLHKESIYGEGTTYYPLFWIPYEKVSPYMVQTRIMTSDINNNPVFNFDDFFITRRYRGSIYKATNLMNTTLVANEENLEKVRAEQARIEEQLKNFEERLWASPSDDSQTDGKSKKRKEKVSKEEPIKTDTKTELKAVPATSSGGYLSN